MCSTNTSLICISSNNSILLVLKQIEFDRRSSCHLSALWSYFNAEKKVNIVCFINKWKVKWTKEKKKSLSENHSIDTRLQKLIFIILYDFRLRFVHFATIDVAAMEINALTLLSFLCVFFSSLLLFHFPTYYYWLYMFCHHGSAIHCAMENGKHARDRRLRWACGQIFHINSLHIFFR